jgi:hypothetical protein
LRSSACSRGSGLLYTAPTVASYDRDIGHLDRKRALTTAVGAIALLTAASAGAVGGVGHAPAAAPKTLVSFRGRIGGFAQDGNRIAWLAPRTSCRDFVQLRNLRTRKQVRLAAKRGASCPPADGYLDGGWRSQAIARCGLCSTLSEPTPS